MNQRECTSQYMEENVWGKLGQPCGTTLQYSGYVGGCCKNRKTGVMKI